MPKGEWGTKRFQDHNTKKPSVENLKNRWADNNISPVLFYWGYFKKYSALTYPEFCELINVWESITLELQSAIDDFWEASK